MKSFRSYTFTRKSASGARVHVRHIYKAGPINPKREAVSESLRRLDRLVKKENSKNLRHKMPINKLLLEDFFFFFLYFFEIDQIQV